MYVLINNRKIEIHDCDDFYSRFKGLMFTNQFDYGLRFSECNSIHTFFMMKNIDVVMTDKDNNVLYIYRNVRPWRVILPKRNVFHTYEFPSGTIKRDIKKINVKGLIDAVGKK
ncbi:MAG: DUF192 domain-containing protein [Bacilli bacterium]|nr:DUF192 domain-containing protein [Bacilli bacterium]